jgi:predicted outer membrane protein
VLNDQSAAKQQALAIGARSHTKPAASSVGNALEKQFDDAMGRLEKGGSLEFDRIYVESQIRLLQNLTRVLDELAPKTASKELKGLVTGMQSRVAHHLEVARGALGNR